MYAELKGIIMNCEPILDLGTLFAGMCFGIILAIVIRIIQDLKGL